MNWDEREKKHSIKNLWREKLLKFAAVWYRWELLLCFAIATPFIISTFAFCQKQSSECERAKSMKVWIIDVYRTRGYEEKGSWAESSEERWKQGKLSVSFRKRKFFHFNLRCAMVKIKKIKFYISLQKSEQFFFGVLCFEFHSFGDFLFE